MTDKEKFISDAIAKATEKARKKAEAEYAHKISIQGNNNIRAQWRATRDRIFEWVAAPPVDGESRLKRLAASARAHNRYVYFGESICNIVRMMAGFPACNTIPTKKNVDDADRIATDLMKFLESMKAQKNAQ